MAKITTNVKTLVYPMPALLIGTNIGDKPNFMTAAWSGVAASTPPMVTVGIRPDRQTFKGIRENMTFSVNVPSIDLVKETDYCGIVSGNKAEKAKNCNFILFYGKLETAPMIEQCPVNLECKVAHILDLGSHSLIVGEIVESYISEDCMTNGEPDIDKIRPITFATHQGLQYLSHGRVIAKAFGIGKDMLKPGDS